MFVPVEDASEASLLAERYLSIPSLTHLYLMGTTISDMALPQGVSMLQTESLLSTSLFADIAERASSDYVLFVAKPGVEIDCAVLDAMCSAMPENASMAYANYRKTVDGKVVDAPVIECQDGSLRNDFDFGPVRLFRTSALKGYAGMQLEKCEYAGLYQLRLALSRLGALFRFDGYLAVEHESDNRRSGEKQFDYVNPAQRSVQVEMEKACTHHLKECGAWLPPCKYEKIDLSNVDFPVEASVVIPVLNRESTIGDAIASVLGQVTSFKFNILVVDNHSTDGTGAIIDSFGDDRVVHIVPESNGLGIGGCWNLAVNDCRCGRFAVQLDSDDIYSDGNTLQRVVDEFYRQQCAMIVGTYRICDFELNTLPPGVIDHREWTEDNGRNNALRINGLGAPRAFYTPVIREVGFPNVSYGEDYAVGLRISRSYRIGRIYDVLYLCRRWGGNSDAQLSHDKVNAHNLYKDGLRTAEFIARKEMMCSLKTPSPVDVEAFVTRQLECWPDAAERHAALDAVRVRRLENGVLLQYNPARAVSVSAKVDKLSVMNRKCFLCAANRPLCQHTLDALGHIDVLVNPFPILPCHLTLPLKEHVPQRIAEMYADMLLLAKEWQDMTIFYNGAKCGASAPDHAHMQAVKKCDVPLFGDEWTERISAGLEPLYMRAGGGICYSDGYLVPLFVVQSSSVGDSVELLARLVASMPCSGGEEPMMNLFCCFVPGEGYTTVVIPRSAHRPACYSTDAAAGRMVSPGALDMAGLMITPREDDFTGISSEEALAILREVAVSDDEAAVIAENVMSGNETY